MLHLGRKMTSLRRGSSVFQELQVIAEHRPRDNLAGARRQQPLETGREEQHIPCPVREVHLQAKWSKMLSCPTEFFFFWYLKNDGLFAISVCQCFISEELRCNMAVALPFFQELLRLGRELEVPDRCQQTALLGTKSGALVQPCKSDRCSERGKLSYTLALY